MFCCAVNFWGRQAAKILWLEILFSRDLNEKIKNQRDYTWMEIHHMLLNLEGYT
jgi:hypothetical protein